MVLCACAALGGTASADDPWESWPEGQLFVGLNARTRVFLDAAYARGKESDELSLDAAAYLDVSFLAIGPYLNGEWFYDTRYDGGHQNEKDHEAFERAVRSGRVKAVFEEAQ